MIKHYCDFCDQEKSEKELNRLILFDRRKIIDNEEVKDICLECMEKIQRLKFKKVAPVQQEEPQKEKASKDEKTLKEAKGQQASKNSIDYGKVWALRKAGWPVKEICAEMKISDASVYIICKKMKALEEATKNADH
jgi:hypothetical protein